MVVLQKGLTMHCTLCNQHNDDDAAFCVSCGEPLEGEQEGTMPRQRRSSLYVFVLVIAFLSLIGLGYYKFFLPQGVVAVVNGEVITRSELDAAVMYRMKAQATRPENGASAGEGSSKERERVRYAILSEMIRERLLLQEAGKAGIQVTEAEVDAALSHMRVSAGMNEGSFSRTVSAPRGSVRKFREAVKRDLLINKLVSENVIKGIADPHQAREAVRNWFHDVSGRATVRITLPEQWSGADRGCCSNKQAVEDDKTHIGMECEGAPVRMPSTEETGSENATGRAPPQ